MGKALTRAIKAADAAAASRLRAVDYLRVSTEEQVKGYGITYTGKATARYIARKGWEHVGTYADEGLSGSLEAHDRPDLLRLMTDSRTVPRPFDMVVVNEGRVIGRTGRAFWRWVWDLEELGVFVAVVKKDYDNSTASGRGQMRKDADYAEEERELIRERTQAGIQEKALAGLYPGGAVPFGWAVKDDRYVVCKKEATTLRRGREVYLAKRSWRTVALTWNAEGRLTRAGKPWTRKNARRVMLSEGTLNSRIIWRGTSAARRADGSLLYGEQVIIKLPKILKKKEAAELRAAADAAPRTVPANTRAYLLSGRLTSPCGSVYMGHNHRPGVYDYRCKGREEKYPGAGGTCSCPALDVDAVEASVWGDVVALLGDADRMQAMAREWIGTVRADHVDHVARIAGLDQRLAEQQQVIDVTMAVAARQAAKRGLAGAEAEAAVEAAIKPLSDELASLEGLRTEALAWQRDVEQAERRVQDFERLAKQARSNLPGLTPALRAELLERLEVQAEVVHATAKRQGVACKLTAWFTSRDRDVPVLTDAGWARVEPLLKGRSDAGPKRPVLEALLLKARTGVRFKDLGEQYGKPATLQTQSTRWLASGAWDAAMELLRDEPAEPAWRPDPIEIRVSLRPLVATESSIGFGADDPSMASHRSALQLTFMTAA